MLKRNDKCYCGSGKKYKKCCMNKDSKIDVQELNNQAMDSKKDRIDKVYTDVISKVSVNLEEMINNDTKLKAIESEARSNFFDGTLENNLIANRFFSSYFLYDFPMSANVTAAAYIANEKKFKESEKKVIDNCIHSYPSVFEIDSVEGRSVVLKDVFTNRKYNTLDAKILGEFNIGDFLMGRPVLVEDTFVLIDLTVKIQEETKKIIFDSIMEAYEKSKTHGISIDYFVMLNSLFFYKYMLQLLEYNNYSDNDEEVEVETTEEESAMLALIGEKVEEAEVLAGMKEIWAKVEAATEITGSETGWAAGLEYYYKKANKISATQKSIAETYGVSTSTLAKRNKEITAILGN